jgi:hypothetical protein
MNEGNSKEGFEHEGKSEALKRRIKIKMGAID